MASRNEVAILITAIDQASRILEEAERSIRDAEQAAADASRGGLAWLQDRLEKGEKASRQLAIALGVALAAVTAAGTGAVVAAGQYEQAEIAFTTMLGSAQEADRFLRDLADFAARTPFEFTGLQDGARKLLAFGFEAEQLIPMLTSIGDAVAALGGGPAEIDRVTRALGQMQAKGNLATQEIMQLAELGIPAWELLAESIGVSVPQAMAMVEARAIDASTGITAILEGLDRRFAGSMQAQSETLLGLWSTVLDEVNLSLTAIGNDIIDTFDLKEALAGAIEVLGTLRETIEEQGISGILEDYRVAIILVSSVISGALVPALWATVTAAAAAVVALAPFLIGGAVIGGLVALAVELRGNRVNADELASSLEKTGRRAIDAKDAITGLKDATDADGLRGAVEGLANTMNMQGRDALLAFAEDTAFPLAAQGELQGAIELTIAKFAELSAASSMAELNSARALVSQTGRQIDLVKDNIAFLEEELESLRADGASAFDLLFTQGLLDEDRAKLQGLTADYEQQMETVNQLNDRTVLYAQTLEGLRTGALTAEEAVEKLSQAFGIAAAFAGDRPTGTGSGTRAPTGTVGGDGDDGKLAPTGSLARLQQDLKAAEEAFHQATTEAARDAAADRIDIIKAEIAEIERRYAEVDLKPRITVTVSEDPELRALIDRTEADRRSRTSEAARGSDRQFASLGDRMTPEELAQLERNAARVLRELERAERVANMPVPGSVRDAALQAQASRDPQAVSDAILAAAMETNRVAAEDWVEQFNRRIPIFVRNLGEQLEPVLDQAAAILAVQQSIDEATERRIRAQVESQAFTNVHGGGFGPAEARSVAATGALRDQGVAAINAADLERMREADRITRDLRDSLDLAADTATAFGDELNLAGNKAGLVEKAIVDLLTLGLDPESEQVQELIRLWSELTEEQEANTAASKELETTLGDVARVANAVGNAIGGLAGEVGNVVAAAAQLASGDTLGGILALGTSLLNLFQQVVDSIRRSIDEIEEMQRRGVATADEINRAVVDLVIHGNREALDALREDLQRALALADSVEAALANGLRDGINAWRAGDSNWKEVLKDSIRDGIVEALIGAFIEAAIAQAGMQKFIDDFVRIYNEQGRDAAIAFAEQNFDAVVDNATRMTEDFLNSLPDDARTGGGTSDGQAAANTSPSGPEVTFGGTPQALQLAVATPLREAAELFHEAAQLIVDQLTGGVRPMDAWNEHAQAMLRHSDSMDRHSEWMDRMIDEGIRVRLEQAPAPNTSSVSTAHLRGT
jgi:tape measure domain-containing protein